MSNDQTGPGPCPLRAPPGSQEEATSSGGQGLHLYIPTFPSKTGSSSLFPFSQTFQRMGDLLEKLNAGIREWDNWIQVVCLVGCKKTMPLDEYYLIGKVSPSLPF